jgi:two-component system, response regulator YesN
MLKMIIADDESIVRHGLRNVIQWENFGIEVVAEAADGQEALDACLELNPDILFTDIRMPMLDGLEVAMKLKELKMNIRVVIISGAQDFNYAKTALDADAEGYVLKPVNIDDLSDVFKKVVNRIKLERNQQSEVTQLKQQLHEHFPLIRENILRNMIHGVYVNAQEINKKMQFYNIPLQTDGDHLVSVLQIDDYSRYTDNLTEEDRQLLIFSIHNIIEEIMNNYNAGIVFSTNENEFVMIFNHNAQSGRKYTEICEEITLCLRKFLDVSVSIGIGRSVGSILSVNLSYKDAATALQYKFYTGKNSILDINDIHIMNEFNPSNIDSSNLYEYENQLMNFVKLGDCESVQKTISNIFDEICSSRNIPIDYVQSIWVEIVCIASRNIRDLGENPDSITGSCSMILEEIYRKENADDLKKYISGIFAEITHYFSKKYNQKNIAIINKIKEIIAKRYNEDLSVAKISGEIYLTPNYISQIFRKETGETITQNITKIRMEQAKKLLKSTDFKILEISEKVGYEDSHYFSKAFKKYTGVHPQKYQSQ